MSLWDKIQYQFNKGNSPVRKLIIINVAIFLLSSLILAIAGSERLNHANNLLSIFYVPAEFGDLIMKPWTLITYMFFHADLRHIIGNMLMLYFIGRILIDFQSNKTFYQIYFLGGLSGALLFLITYAISPSFAGGNGVMLGASGAVIAIVVATAILVPNYELFLFGAFRVKMKWIALFLILTDLMYFNAGNQGGHLAHLGGALFGALYMLNEQGRLNLSFLDNIKNPFKPKYSVIDERDIIRNKKEPVKTASSSESRSKKRGKRTSSDTPRQEEIDAILDKINQSGYPSLTKEEKELLFRASDK